MSSMRPLGLACVFLAAAALGAGCGVKVREKDQANLVCAGYKSVDKLLCKAPDDVPRQQRVLTASFVDLDDFTASSSLGRLMGQVAAARLTQRGAQVVNVNLRRDNIVIVPGAGEFMLSRDVKVLSRDYQADYVLVGTYTHSPVPDPYVSVSRQIEASDDKIKIRCLRQVDKIPDYVYVSLRLVRACDNTVVAAYDYRVLADEGVQALVAGPMDYSLP